MKKLLNLFIWLLLIVCLTAKPAAADNADTADDANNANRVNIVFISYEPEYHSAETLPRFASLLSERFGCRCSVLQGEEKTGIAGLEKLASADLLVLYMRRNALPKEQMAMVRRYLEAGKPLVALRTSSHALDIKAEPPAGMEVWPSFDHDVLGGNYHDHYKGVGRTQISAAADAADHPILKGIKLEQWSSDATLYKVSPLAADTTVLLTGNFKGNKEPIVWTRINHGGRVFYTSLGNVQDFQTPQFRTMLVNAIYWAMEKPVPR